MSYVRAEIQDMHRSQTATGDHIFYASRRALFRQPTRRLKSAGGS
jgi:hypothetical protein